MTKILRTASSSAEGRPWIYWKISGIFLDYDAYYNNNNDNICILMDVANSSAKLLGMWIRIKTDTSLHNLDQTTQIQLSFDTILSGMSVANTHDGNDGRVLWL